MDLIESGLRLSPVSETLVEESVFGVERIRNGGCAGQRRQRHYHLFHRKH